MIGVRAYYRTVSRGWFHCQRCGGDRPYRLRSGSRWLHFFLLPLLPLGNLGKHVQCAACHTCYRPQVLALPTTAQMQAALPAAVRAAASAMLLAGDPADALARSRARTAVRAAGQPGYDDNLLDDDLAAAVLPGRSLANAVRTVAVQLHPPAPEWFLAEVVRIGLADGLLSHRERAVASQVAAHLGLTIDEADGVIRMTEEEASAG